LIYDASKNAISTVDIGHLDISFSFFFFHRYNGIRPPNQEVW
jgi:hypothetical protein